MANKRFGKCKRKINYYQHNKQAVQSDRLIFIADCSRIKHISQLTEAGPGVVLDKTFTEKVVFHSWNFMKDQPGHPSILSQYFPVVSF